MSLVTVSIPEYAARYLQEMCVRERSRIDYGVFVNQAPPTLQDLAAYDALNQIESALP